MKLEFNRKYFTISIYVIFALVGTYILAKIVDSAAYILTNVAGVFEGVGGIFSGVFSVFAVLIMALVLSYLLDPLVDFFQRNYDKLYADKVSTFSKKHFKKLTVIRKKKPKDSYEKFCRRTAGTLLTYSTFILIIAALILFVYWRVNGSSDNTITNVGTKPDFIDSLISISAKSTYELGELYNKFLVDVVDKGANSGVTDVIASVAEYFKTFSSNLVATSTDFLMSTGSWIMNFSLAIVVAFYFLRDKEKLFVSAEDFMVTFFPKKFNKILFNFFDDANVIFSGYIRGQLTDALIIGTLISIALSLIGVKFAVFIGIFSGFAGIIPYFGSIIGFILSITVALLTGDVSQAVMAAIAILALQQIDGMFIVPKVVGEKVELSPAVVILSLSVFGSLFGIFGMIFAVPITAILKIYVIRLSDRKKKYNMEKERELQFTKNLDNPT